MSPRPASPRSVLGRVLLALALVAAVAVLVAAGFTLAVWQYGSPDGPGEFGDAFGLVNAMFSGLALIGVVYTLFHQNRAFQQEVSDLQDQTRSLHNHNVYQVLTTLLLEYRSIEMFTAIRRLWAFHTAHKDDLVAAYTRIKKADDERISGLPEAERLSAENATLHYQRQLVSRFYQLLAGLVAEKVVSPSLVYNYWNRGQLRVIPEILEPIERSLDNTYNLGQANKGLMRGLYDDSPSART